VQNFNHAKTWRSLHLNSNLISDTFLNSTPYCRSWACYPYSLQFSTGYNIISLRLPSYSKLVLFLYFSSPNYKLLLSWGGYTFHPCLFSKCFLNFLNSWIQKKHSRCFSVNHLATSCWSPMTIFKLRESDSLLTFAVCVLALSHDSIFDDSHWMFTTTHLMLAETLSLTTSYLLI
jgi:hypothetical protein